GPRGQGPGPWRRLRVAGPSPPGPRHWRTLRYRQTGGNGRSHLAEQATVERAHRFLATGRDDGRVAVVRATADSAGGGHHRTYPGPAPGDRGRREPNRHSHGAEHEPGGERPDETGAPGRGNPQGQGF